MFSVDSLASRDGSVHLSCKKLSCQDDKAEGYTFSRQALQGFHCDKGLSEHVLDKSKKTASSPFLNEIPLAQSQRGTKVWDRLTGA